jgi:hypothetical protein
VPATPPIPAIPIAAAGDATTYATAGHGIWQLSPAVTNFFVQYIRVAANSNGSLYGKTTTTMTIGLNPAGTQLRGAYTSQLADPSGNILKTSTGTIYGQPIPHPKLP